ncbi:MAG: hypothetical protein JNK72_06990 [Myxococcales bacterium]|nr:hypothetical protein [Myxococcales bacterium]
MRASVRSAGMGALCLLGGLRLAEACPNCANSLGVSDSAGALWALGLVPLLGALALLGLVLSSGAAQASQDDADLM